jgi:hypothetical protein
MKDKFYYFNQTPKQTAKRLFDLVPYGTGDSFLEPFRGEGAFYDLMPEPKDWAEIEMGRDFFLLPFQADHIVTNPPFRDKSLGNNIFVSGLERCLHDARKSVSMLINLKMLNALTPVRLTKYKKDGWRITGFYVLNIKEWFGRWYFIRFEKEGREALKVLDDVRKNESV